MQSIQHTPERPLWQARFAVGTVFFIMGAIFANWAVRIPTVSANLDLSEGELGLALMLGSVGVILGLLITGGLIARFGSHRVSTVMVILKALSLGFISLAVDFYTLSLVLFFYGMSNSMTDVAINAQAIEVERKRGKPIMNSFHGLWSIGTFVGSLIGTGFINVGTTTAQHFWTLTVIFMLIAFATQHMLLRIDGEKDQNDQAPFSLPPRMVWGLGAVAFAAGISEGAVADWSGLYLRDIVEVSEAWVPLGFVAFSLTMTTGRFLGDTVAEWLGNVRLIRLSGVLATSGILLPIFFPSLVTALLGFGIAGLGLAVGIPLAFSASGKLPNISPGRAVAGVATIGYAGFLVGPPIIGFVAEATSLRFGLAIVAMLASTMIFTAGALDVRKAKSA
ncbi:MAG: MFS transporter [Chloroflexota bacterium]